MSTIIPSMPSSSAGGPIPPAPTQRPDVLVEDKLVIPGWIDSLASYRRWAESDGYPQCGWVAYLNGKIWVDLNMEEFLSHNQIKQAFNYMFGTFLTPNPLGRFVPDRMLLANEAANLSTEPDGMFYLRATMQTGRLRLVPGKNAGYMQLEGTPDIALEIVSDSSVTKDLVQLRDLYWKAQIPEYWLVDARRDAIRFDILRYASEGYQPATPEDGWLCSSILGHFFRIERSVDPLGITQVDVRYKA